VRSCYAADFAQRVVEMIDVLQAVIGDNGIERLRGKGKLRGVGEYEIRGWRRWAFEVDPDDGDRPTASVETTATAAEI
jgi:hypothetical protein